MSDVKLGDAFDICGPLPHGVTVLEASAGTGKTYTIAALATRYVADGMPLEQLLLVTFTRLATGELRDRVRRRLTAARRARCRAGRRRGAGSEAWTPRIGSRGCSRRDAGRGRGTPRPPGARDRRLRRRDDHHDARLLSGGTRRLGVAGDIDRGHHFSEDARDLVEEVVDDLYVKDFLDNPPAFSRAEARAVADAAVANPSAPLAPVAPGERGRAAPRAGRGGPRRA